MKTIVQSRRQVAAFLVEHIIVNRPEFPLDIRDLRLYAANAEKIGNSGVAESLEYTLNTDFYPPLATGGLIHEAYLLNWFGDHALVKEEII